MIVSLDTSCLTLSLALTSRDGALVEEVRIGAPIKQSEVLPQAVSELLARHQLALKDVSGFVVGLGPGSFTGLRIGVSAIKGLAYALNQPVCGVSSLAAIAREVQSVVGGRPSTGSGRTESVAPVHVHSLFVIASVKRGELYVERFVDGVSAEPVFSETVAAFAARCEAAPGSVVAGPALDDVRTQLEQLGVPSAQLLASPTVPSATHLAQLADWSQAKQGAAMFSLEPHYVRGSGAEENPKFPPLVGVPALARLKEE